MEKKPKFIIFLFIWKKPTKKNQLFRSFFHDVARIVRRIAFMVVSKEDEEIRREKSGDREI